MASVRQHFRQTGIGIQAHEPFNRRLAQVGIDQERAFALFRIHHGQRERERRFSFARQGRW